MYYNKNDVQQYSFLDPNLEFYKELNYACWSLVLIIWTDWLQPN